jgi:hypothetical protein
MDPAAPGRVFVPGFEHVDAAVVIHPARRARHDHPDAFAVHARKARIVPRNFHRRAIDLDAAVRPRDNRVLAACGPEDQARRHG